MLKTKIHSIKSVLTCILGCQVHHLLLLFSSYGSTKDPYKTRQICAITTCGQKMAYVNHFPNVGNIGAQAFFAINQFSVVKVEEKWLNAGSKPAD